MKLEVLVITGNPGVGKHTVGRMLARKLRMKLVDINKVALERGAIIKKDRLGYVVDLRKLSRILKKVSDDSLVVGHLAPYVLDRNADLVIVLRRSPYELEQVYGRRGYSRQKSADNISSEIIGVCIYDAIKKFGRKKIAEVDSTEKNAERVVGEIISIMQGKSVRPAGRVDWLAVITKNDDLHKFFEYGE